MKDRILNSQNLGNANGGGVPNGGHLAPALSHATAASGFGIDDLRKFCTFHLSFVKGMNYALFLLNIQSRLLPEF